MRFRILAWAALLAASPLSGTLSAGSLSPGIGAGNTAEIAAIRAGHADTPGVAAPAISAGRDGAVVNTRPTAADAKTDAGRGAR